MPPATLGLAIIARDEEETLPRLLDSVRGAFDQVVLLDTGSVDATISVFETWAEKQQLPLGHKVGRFEWVDDFGAARNAAHDLLDCEWHVRADADEEIRGAKLLRERIVNLPSGVTMVRVPIRVAGMWWQWERIVRRGHHRWYGRIHELQWSPGRVVDLEQRKTDPDCAWLESPLAEDAHERLGPKYRRNLGIIESWAQELPGHPTPVALMATEEFSHGDISKAPQHLEEYLRLPRIAAELGARRVKEARIRIPLIVPGADDYLLHVLGVLGRLPQWWLLEDELPVFNPGPLFPIPAVAWS